MTVYKITFHMPSGTAEIECPDDTYILDAAEQYEDGGTSSLGMFGHFVKGRGKSRTLDELGLKSQVRNLIYSPNALGKLNGHSLQGDFIQQILSGSSSFVNSYPLKSVLSNPLDGLWALGSVTISGNFDGGVTKEGSRYFLKGVIHYTLNDDFSDPYDTFNSFSGENNWGGDAYHISDSWSEPVNLEITREKYERLK